MRNLHYWRIASRNSLLMCLFVAAVSVSGCVRLIGKQTVFLDDPNASQAVKIQPMDAARGELRFRTPDGRQYELAGVTMAGLTAQQRQDAAKAFATDTAGRSVLVCPMGQGRATVEYLGQRQRWMFADVLIKTGETLIPAGPRQDVAMFLLADGLARLEEQYASPDHVVELRAQEAWAKKRGWGIWAAASSQPSEPVTRPTVPAAAPATKPF